jgi:hypothetical protein
MEFAPFFPNLPYMIANQTWFNNTDYMDWIKDNPNIMYEFASPLVYTFSGDRREFYNSPSFEEIKNKAT